MSVDTLVYFPADAVPTAAAWQEQLDRQAPGLVLDLDDGDDLRVFSGFVPATLHDRDTGFEWFLSPVAEDPEDHPAGVDPAALAACFTTHGNLHELAAAWLAAAVLTGLTGGRLLDEETGRLLDGPAASAAASKLAAEVAPPPPDAPASPAPGGWGRLRRWLRRA